MFGSTTHPIFVKPDELKRQEERHQKQLDEFLANFDEIALLEDNETPYPGWPAFSDADVQSNMSQFDSHLIPYDSYEGGNWDRLTDF